MDFIVTICNFFMFSIKVFLLFACAGIVIALVESAISYLINKYIRKITIDNSDYVCMWGTKGKIQKFSGEPWQ